MKLKLWLPLLLLSLPAWAGWIEDSVTLDVTTEDPKLIATSITQFQEMLNYLNAENLTAPSRVRIQKFAGRLARYHWENDAECSVKDPSLIVPTEMSTSHVDFYYEADSSQLWAVDALANKANPCSVTPKPYIKKAPLSRGF